MPQQYTNNEQGSQKWWTLVIILYCCLIITVTIPPVFADNATEYAPDNKGYRFEQDGWTYLHIEGGPFERGYQHGYLMAPELAEVHRALTYLTYHDTGMSWDYFIDVANKMFINTIDQEYRDEIEGIAAGAQAAGTNISADEVLGWNSYKELTGYWWPTTKSDVYKKMEIETDSCSAFIATGSYTKDGEILMAHNTWTPYERARFFHIIADVVPDNGHRILMQSAPGLLDSSTDYLITDAGLMITETTINAFNQYKVNESPAFFRLRKAAQYADDPDSFVKIMNTNNSGGFANSWLIGDTHTGEIMRFEQGLKFHNISRTKDGYYVGANSVEDPRIRNFETSGLDPTEIRMGVGSRMVRLPRLMEENKGELNQEIAKRILSDHYDVYLQSETPSTRTIEGHYELDGVPFTNRVPYRPMGCYDGKVTTAQMARNLSFEARWGAPSGLAFDADAFLIKHPQFNYLKGYLDSFPVHSWNTFSTGQLQTSGE
ncbi:MAG TPA: C45 family peptidase [Methanospirillum sp.]|nr:C45 family peptidase [Methanospirillum sp.]